MVNKKKNNMNCIVCKRYFKQNAFNRTAECDSCLDGIFTEIDSELEVDVNLLRNPSGRTNPIFYDEYNDPEQDCRDSI